MNLISLSLVFGAGVATQTTLFIANRNAKDRSLRLGLAILISLAGLLPGRSEVDYTLHGHICDCFMLYTFLILVLFKKEILARVSESSLLVNSLVFWYLCITFFNGSTTQWRLLSIAALPTLATLIIAFTVKQWSFAVRLTCYGWFLILMLAIYSFQVHFGNMSFIWSHKDTTTDPFNLFLTGMAFVYLAASVFYIYILIPMPGKHESFADRMVTWKQDAHLMASCFAEYRMTAREALTLLIFQGGLYATNYFFRLVSVPLMVNLTLLFLPYLFRRLSHTRKPVRASTVADDDTSKINA